ncbi:MAG: hypothetical protein AMR96_02610 [Candidatus Adiutrix intracellularis]|jgi:hypothetical protein|nr:MAG: hypothetical protein AMR96_02610 [Candidatus Adiutrix intracellularis]
MDKLKCTLEVLRNKSAILRADNATLQDKVTELETKLSRAKSNSTNSLKLPSSDITNTYQFNKKTQQKAQNQNGIMA